MCETCNNLEILFILHMVKCRNKYVAHSRRCRKDFDRLQTDKLLKIKCENVKEYWRMLNKSNKVAKKPNITDNQFFYYFKQISLPDDPFYGADADIVAYVNNTNSLEIMYNNLDKPFTVKELESALKRLKQKKAAGLDLLLNEFFIHGKIILIPILTKVYNNIFAYGYFPSTWSDGLILPLHKKGSVDNVEIYRDITLLSTLSKLFIKMLNERLNLWAESNSVYIEAQSGFRSNLGTVDDIFVLHNIVDWCISNKKKLYCAFLDYSKAFDNVVRDNLWYKLLKVGIRGKMITMLQSIYSSVKSSVRDSSSVTKSFECTIGVRKVESLSPFLFVMFVNDIEEHLRRTGSNGIDLGIVKLFILLYADDGVLLSESAQGLQPALDSLYKYRTRWKLTLKEKKRYLERVGENTWFYNENPIEIVNIFCYLEIEFSHTGSFSKTQAVLAQGRKALFWFKSKIKQFLNIDPVKCDLFDKLVLPVLMYGCKVWGFYPAKAIEQVHKDFCKNVL